MQLLAIAGVRGVSCPWISADSGNEESKQMAKDQDDAIEVMLDVYSGRPNPTWTLTAREVEELKRLLEASRGERREEGPQSPYLGYTGFVITNRSLIAGIPYRFRAHGGVLAVRDEPPEEAAKKGKEGHEGKKPKGRAKKHKQQKTVYYGDRHRIESWLLEQAVGRGYTETIEKMGGPRLRPVERDRP
jgi:hypothetical protein